MSDATIRLGGSVLTIAELEAAARGAPVAILPEARERMRASRAVIEGAVSDRRAIYGVTTGLGARVNEVLDGATLAAFSVQTLRGRAQAVGEAEPVALVRAGMIVRLNTLLSGLSSASPEVADHLLACLNARLTPVTGRIGSIGPSDLVVNATVGLALTGEGRMHAPEGIGDACEVMQRHGISPLQLGPRDGLALAGHCGPAAGGAALALAATGRVFRAAQTAAALSLEGFRATLTPLDPRALAAKPLPGQTGAAADLRRRLEGSRLWQSGQARRLQDPLSLRHVVQIHGAVQLAMEQAERVVLIEINGSSDNPIVDVASGDVVPTGAYYSAELGLVCETLTRALLGAAMAQIARIARLLDPRSSDLPPFLARDAATSNGFAPLMKTAEALVAEIAHAAQPPAIWPSLNAMGIEDTLSSTPVAVRALERAAENMALLVAIEFIVAAQAIDLRGCAPDLGDFLGRCHAQIRKTSPQLVEDRSLSGDIAALAEAIAEAEFEL
jgi:histidine ammonia-lyase